MFFMAKCSPNVDWQHDIAGRNRNVEWQQHNRTGIDQ